MPSMTDAGAGRRWRSLAAVIAAGIVGAAGAALAVRTVSEWLSPATVEARATAAPAAAPAATVGAAAEPRPGLAHEDRVTYHYNVLGRRDPFQSLVDGEFVGADHGGDVPPDIGGLKVVGIVWGDADRFALVEDVRGHSYVLRRGDKVMNGHVEGLRKDGLIVNLTVDGQSHTVTIPLTRKGEQSNASR